MFFLHGVITDPHLSSAGDTEHKLGSYQILALSGASIIRTSHEARWEIATCHWHVTGAWCSFNGPRSLPKIRNTAQAAPPPRDVTGQLTLGIPGR